MTDAIESMPVVERRSHRDRRSPQKQFAGLKFGRRRDLRRSEDRQKVVLLDQYPKPLLIAAAVVLLLSLGDAVMTLFLVSHGAIELNPIMDYFLKAGSVYFVVVKYSLTAAAVTIVLLLNYYRLRGLNIHVRSFLSLFTVIFSAVIAWQIYLVATYVF
jgi:hypothetical protein